MLLNLSDVFKVQGKVMREITEPELDRFRLQGMEFPVISKSPAEWIFTNIETGKAKVEGKVQLVFRAPCDRCLGDVDVPLMLQIERYVVPALSEEVQDDDVDDLSFMEGYSINTETLLYNEIMENWPEKILCREDCKGLCLVCGKNLNDGECGCDRFVPDPRMAAIKDVFNACKEV